MNDDDSIVAGNYGSQLATTLDLQHWLMPREMLDRFRQHLLVIHLRNSQRMYL